MRKAFLSMTLFLLICFAANAQYSIKKQVVGTGGFVAKAVDSKVMHGIFGQPVIGIKKPQATGDNTVMYMGFWLPPLPNSVEGDAITAKGVINFPNPVSNFTSFKFNLKESGYVTLNVYNQLGSLVATVTHNEFLPAGQNSVEWNAVDADGRTLNVGSYMYEVVVTPTNSSRAYFFRNMLMISK